MASQKPLIISGGSTQRIPDADTLVVGVGIDAATAGVLTIGGTTATSITLGSATIPVSIPGDVVTVGGTTFTTDATFEGNVTFGAGAADTVTFAALTTVTSDINFGGAPGTYKITNLANGTNPNDAVNFSQLSAIVSGVSAVTATAPLLSSGGSAPDISIDTAGASNGDVLTYNGSAWAAAAPSAAALTVGSTAIASGAVNRVLFEGAGNVLQESANLTWDGSSFTVNGVVAVGEGSAPAATAAFGKLWANSAADARPYWLDDTGQSFNLTLDRFNTLTPAASVAIDTDPALPVFNSLSLDQDTTFTTSNLGNGRSASVRVVCDGTTRNLTFPGGWTWLGSGPPSSLAANDVGYLSITAYGATDADVVAAWSYENQPVAVTGSGTATRVAFWSGSSTLSSDADLYWDDTNNRLGVGTATPTTAIDLASGQLAIPDGSAAAPAIAFRDDLDTGIFSPSNDIVGVAVNGTEIARLQQSGAGSTPVLLMGTSTALGAISVDSSDPSGAAGVVMLAHSNAGTVIQESYRGGQFAGVRSRGTKAAPTQIGAGDGMVNVLGAGWTATGGINYGAMMTMKAEQAFTSTASGGRIELHTTTNSTDGFTTLGGATTERLRIANDGRVSVGQSGGAIVPAASGAILTLAGGITQSGGAVSLTGNAASSLTTSSGALTLTSAAAATWSSTAGNLAISGGAALQLAAAAGNEVVVNDGSADVDFRVESNAQTHALFVDAGNDRVGVFASTLTHTFNVGDGTNSNFSVASGGRIHTYDGTAPTDGQVLIGDTVGGNFAKAALTAGSGITITNGAGSITIAAVAGTDYSVVTLTTAQPVNTAVTVGGAAAIATAASTSRVAGIVTATDTVKVLGICTCDVEGALSIAAGDAVYLSASDAGAVTNVAPSTATQVVAELGIATAASGGGTVTVLWQPKSIIVL